MDTFFIDLFSIIYDTSDKWYGLQIRIEWTPPARASSAPRDASYRGVAFFKYACA